MRRKMQSGMIRSAFFLRIDSPLYIQNEEYRVVVLDPVADRDRAVLGRGDADDDAVSRVYDLPLAH